MNTPNVMGETIEMAFMKVARCREVSLRWALEYAEFHMKTYESTEHPTWQAVDGKRKKSTVKGGCPDWALFSIYKKHHFDVDDATKWSYKIFSDTPSSLGRSRVNASDQVVFWTSLYMDNKTRAEESALGSWPSMSPCSDRESAMKIISRKTRNRLLIRKKKFRPANAARGEDFLAGAFARRGSRSI